MYTDPGIISLIIAFIVGVGLVPFYVLRDKIKSIFKRNGDKNDNRSK